MNLKEIPAIDTDQMIEVDRLMIEEYGIELVQMMENAGRNLADLAQRLIGERKQAANMLILCGAGNNGGGGMVTARHLHNRGINVEAKLVAAPEKLKEIALKQWRILGAMGLQSETKEIPDVDIILDAMIGYGLKGNPRDPVAQWIEEANQHKAPILSLDAPSGLNTSSGNPGTPCIKARATMTLALPKIGMLSDEGRSVLGDLFLADISVPPELYDQMGLKVPILFSEQSIIQLR